MIDRRISSKIIAGPPLKVPGRTEGAILRRVEEFPDDAVFDTIIIDGTTDTIYGIVDEDEGSDPEITRLPGRLARGEIFLEDPESGITVLLDLSEWGSVSPPKEEKRSKAPYTWDDDVETDGIVEAFFSEKVMT